MPYATFDYNSSQENHGHLGAEDLAIMLMLL